MTDFDRNVGVYIAEAVRGKRAVHAYIVVGEKQSITKLLTECALALMCVKGGTDGCEVCRKIIKNEHQDVVRIPQDTQKNRLTVADIAYLVEESFKRPVDNSASRVFLVDASDSAVGIGSESWQNKLLKTLEEPTEGVYIVIGVTDAESLLPTVRSRCQILRQSSLSADEVKKILLQTGFDGRSCEMVAALSGGSAQAGERLLRDSYAFKAYETAIAMAENMTSTKNALQFVAAVLSNKERVYDFLRFLTVLFRESIVARLQPELRLLPSLSDTIDKICANYTLEASEACIEIINEAKRALDDSGNLSVCIDRMTNRILEIKYRCRP